MEFSTPEMDTMSIGPDLDALWMAMLFVCLEALLRDDQQGETALCQPCASTIPLWTCCTTAHWVGKITCLPISVVPYIEAGPMPFPNIIWLGILRCSLQRRISSNCIVKLHSPDNGLNTSLSADPYAYHSHGAGITVAVAVILIWYQLVYMCGPVFQIDKHGQNINYCHAALTLLLSPKPINIGYTFNALLMGKNRPFLPGNIIITWRNFPKICR